MNQPAQTITIPPAVDPATAYSHPHEPDTVNFWPAWRWWLPCALASLILIVVFVDPFIGDWDALDYTILSLHGEPSSMALGRGLFTMYNHALYELAHAIFHVPPSKAYLVFKYAVVAQGPLAVIMSWILARDLTRSLHAATIAALLLALSPVFIIYSGQVMTDVPAVLLVCVSLLIHYRGLCKGNLWLVLIGAALLGAGVNLRETTAFFAPWLAFAPFVCGWKSRKQNLFIVLLSGVIFIVVAFGPFTYWMLSNSEYRAGWFGWRESMRQESARHPVTITNLLPFLAYVFVTTPLLVIALPSALRREARERGLSPLFLLAAVGIVADVLLLLNYSTVIVWRYPLASVPALAPLAGQHLIRITMSWLKSIGKAMAACIGSMIILAALFGLYIRPVSRQFIQWRALSKNYNSQLAHLPRDAVVMAGQQTVAVTYWRGVGAGEWDTIGTGGGWPGTQLPLVITHHLAQGRRVFLDADPRWWFVCGWQRQEIPEVARLEQQFHFHHVTDYMFEIRPLADVTASDNPDLKKLLPENRPEDVALCPLGRR